MPDMSPVFDVTFSGWQVYQRKLVTVVGSLTAEQLDHQPAPALRSPRKIAVHLIAARASWFCDMLHEGDVQIGAIARWDEEDQPMRTSAELVHGLQATWMLLQDALARWMPEQLVEPVILPGSEGYTVSRAWVIWHLLEHDLHHGGELAYALGLQGLTIGLPPGPED